MLISTAQGKVISMSLEQYLSLTDQQYDDLMYSNIGTDVNDPFSIKEATSKDILNEE